MPGETIRLIDPQGEIRDVPIEAAGGALDGGWKVPTSEQEIGRVAERAREVNYGGVAGGIKAGAAAFARGATLGLSDVAARAFGGEDARIALEGLRETNPGLSTGFEIGGAALPALVSGGAALPAGAASRLGTGVARTLETRAIQIPLAEAGAASRIGAAAAGATVEGGLFGIGTGVSELALSDDPITVERIASSLSSHALYGAGVGAAAGTLGKSLELGLRRAKGAIDGALEKRALSKARTPAEAIETGDLSMVDSKILDAAERSELERIKLEQAPQRKAFTDELDTWRKANRDAHDLREITRGSDDVNLREASGAFDRANLRLRAALDDRVGFAEDPVRSLKVVRAQGQALDEMRSAARAHEARWQQDVAEAPARIRSALEEVSALGTPQRTALTQRETNALYEYQGGKYHDIQEFARTGKVSEGSTFASAEEAQARAELLDSAIAKSPLAEATTVYRGIGSGMSGPGRGIRGKIAVGEVITDPGFTSTSVNRSAALDYFTNKPGSTLFEIKVPKGTRAARVMDSNLNEEELLLGRGSRYRILSVKNQKIGDREVRVVKASLEPVEGEMSGAALLKARKERAAYHGLGDEIGPFTEAGLDAATERVLKERMAYQWGGAVKGGLKEPAIVSRISKIDAMIAENQRLQAQLEALAKPPTSDLLTKIADARAVLSGPKEPSLGQAVLGAAVPFAGPIAGAVAAGNRVLGSFKQLAAAAATRLQKAASAFLGAAAPATKYATPLATRTLAAARFDEDDRKGKQPTKLPELYKARSEEVKRQVHIAADGSYQMRPSARQKLAAKFDGIRVSDPRLADQLETAGARRIEYLASILPRLPDYGVVQLGPERRRVNELAMRTWARAVAALDDPHAVFERAAHGRVLPAEARALRAVHQPLLDAFMNDVMAGLPALEKTPHRDKRMALSILMGRPMDPALTVGVQRVIQGMYATEPGTAGGTQAPRPEPAFGSVKADKGTQAQKRQGENT